MISGTSLHVSRGWTETIDSATESVHSDAVWKAAYKILLKPARLHTFVGNKRLSIFDMRVQTEPVRKRLFDWVAGSAINDLAKVINNSPFDVISAPTDEAVLEVYKRPPPKLIEARLVKGKLYLQFFSARTYTKREPIEISLMTPRQQRVFAEYDQIIGVKTQAVPCFDTVVVDPVTELVQIRVDFQPGMVESKETSAFSLAVTEFNRITEKFISRSALGAGIVNMHPAIDPLYRDQDCGRVTTLGFVATGKSSSSNNRGQLHRNKTKDFRKDEFHTGGKNNVQRIDPYAIGITWENAQPKRDLYLEIHGSARAIYQGKLRMTTVASVVGCADAGDFDFVVDNVLKRIKRS
ncbi:hypothetical protein [Delftia sp.]|uniref:hypothetical protein n=1 Tax=Delftia sp. TaxID=1886637 RepID=UPI00259CD441|nr:hypothetical protein [Delftia sp.]